MESMQSWAPSTLGTENPLQEICFNAALRARNVQGVRKSTGDKRKEAGGKKQNITGC